MAAPLYLYTGPEFGEREDAIIEIKKSLKKKYGSVDEHLFYLVETPFNQVMTILQSGTLFSDAICIVCKNAELLKKKDDLQMISDWLESAEETAVLILVSDEISVDAKLTKIVPASNKKQFWEMFEDKKLPWIYNFIKKNGYEIEQDAAECILQMIENNTLALKQECSRFFMCFAKGHRITIEDVESVLSHNREENAFTLFNHMADSTQAQQKRLENSLNILQSIRLSKDSSSVKIIAGLSSCFRKLATWISINDDGYVDEQVLRQNGFSSKLQQKQYRSAAKLWTIGQTTAILAILAATDMEIRSNGSLMEDVLLQKMIYEIVIKKGATISSAEY